MSRRSSNPLNFTRYRRRRQAARKLRASAIGALAGLAVGGSMLQLVPMAGPVAAQAQDMGADWAVHPRPPSAADSAARLGFTICHSGGGINCVVDGDTVWIAGEKIRVADIDAPETHPPRCADEAAKGAAATQRLRALLNQGPFDLVVQGRDRDRYGRALRVIVRNGRSLGDQLVEEGLARSWTGRREPWC